MIKTSLLFATFGIVLSSVSSIEPKKSIFDSPKSYSKDSVCETNEGYSDVVGDLINMQFDLSSLTGNEAMSMNQVFISSSNSLETFLYCFSYDAYVPTSAFISTSKFRKDEYSYNETFNEYNLQVVSRTSDGCLTKCLVEGLDNLLQQARRYNVSMICLDNPKEITSISFGMEFYFHTNEEKIVEGTFQVKEVVTITSGVIKDCFFAGGENKYKGNLSSVSTYEDSFYYFFNTDWKIDELVEVDVQYYSFSIFIPAFYKGSKFGYVYSYDEYMKDADKYINDGWANLYESDLTANSVLHKDFPFIEEAGEINELKKYVSSTLDKNTKTVTPGEERTEYNSTGWKWFAPYTVRKYAELNNIVDLRDYTFKEGDAFNFTDMKKKYEFGIRFEKAERTYYQGAVDWKAPWTWGKDPFGVLVGKGVEQTCITRLKFYKDGKLYDLGTVDIPRPTDEDPIPGEPGIEIKEPNWWEVVLAVVLGITGFYIIYQLVSPLFKKKRGKKHA